eukprot:sb/3464466/
MEVYFSDVMTGILGEVEVKLSRRLRVPKSTAHTILLSLCALFYGAKPALLFDFCPISKDQLSKLLADVLGYIPSYVTNRDKDVFKERSDWKERNNFVVVELVGTNGFGDIFVVDKTADYSDYNPYFIDCSRGLKSGPVLADQGVVSRHWQVFKEFLRDIKSGTETLSCTDESVCFSTLYGMFLKYPYLYYTCNESNCLSGEPLYLVELALPERHLTGVIGIGCNQQNGVIGCDDVISNAPDTNNPAEPDSLFSFTQFTIPVSICDERRLGELKKLRERSDRDTPPPSDRDHKITSTSLVLYHDIAEWLPNDNMIMLLHPTSSPEGKCCLIAGGVAAMATSPLDVIKTRLQVTTLVRPSFEQNKTNTRGLGFCLIVSCSEEPTNQNSLFRSRDWLSANQGPVFPDGRFPSVVDSVECHQTRGPGESERLGVSEEGGVVLVGDDLMSEWVSGTWVSYGEREWVS